MTYEKLQFSNPVTSVYCKLLLHSLVITTLVAPSTLQHWARYSHVIKRHNTYCLILFFC